VIWVHSKPEKLLEIEQKWEAEIAGLFFLNKNSIAHFTKFVEQYPDLWSVDNESRYVHTPQTCELIADVFFGRLRIIVATPGDSHTPQNVIEAVHTAKRAQHVPILIDPSDYSTMVRLDGLLSSSDLNSSPSQYQQLQVFKTHSQIMIAKDKESVTRFIKSATVRSSSTLLRRSGLLTATPPCPATLGRFQC